MDASSLLALLPLIVLALAALAVMIGIAIARSHKVAAILSFAAIVVSFISLWPASTAAPRHVTSLLLVDGYGLLYIGLLLAASGVVVVLAFPYLENRSEHREEFYILLLLATLGSAVLAVSSHMASFFLGLELLSVSLYALIAYPRTETLSLEAGIKYLVLAASSAAFLLLGLSFIYTASGTMEFALMGPGNVHLSDVAARSIYFAGFALTVTGIGFKLAIVPFHLWTPDVYEGAPVPVTAFVATVSKGGVFAFLLRWVQNGDVGTGPILFALWLVAIASMLVGNLLALRQTNIKRLLAYSSIAHMGYFLVALIAGGSFGAAAATYYLAGYIVTILGAFGVLCVLSGPARRPQTLDDVQGLFWRRPLLASVFTVMLLSLAGIPLTAGFLGKFYVLTAGASAASWTLVFVLIASSTIGLAYYLRAIVAMFTASTLAAAGEPDARPPQLLGMASRLALAALVVTLFVLGVYPGPLWDAVRTVAANLG